MKTSCQLRRIAVIGAGAAGRDLALRCVRTGFDVILEDVTPSRLRNAAALAREQQSIASAAPVGTLHLASSIEEAVRHADLAIDFVPDELESKLEIFSLLDRMAPPRTILCTPTTALSIADLASCTYRPQLCFGLRFPSTNSAELIHTSRSSPDALSAVADWLTATGLTVSRLSDPAETPASTKLNPQAG